MFRARRIYQEHLRDNDTFLASHMASNLSSASTRTTMTAFEFDSVIKATAVYQRCMRRRGNATSLLSLGLSMEPSSSFKEEDTAATDEGDPASKPDSQKTIAEISIELDKGLLHTHLDGSEHPQQVSVLPPGSFIDHLHAQSPIVSSNTEHRRVDDELSLRDTSHEQLLGRSEQERVADALPRIARSDSHERTKQKVIEKLLQRQRETRAESAERRKNSDNVFYDHGEPIMHMTISSRHVLATASRSMIRLRKLDTGEDVVKIRCHPLRSKNKCPIFSSDGAFLSAAHYAHNGKMTTSVWNAETGARLCTLSRRFETWITASTICSNGTSIACAKYANELHREHKYTVWLFETATGRPVGDIRLRYEAETLSFIQGDKQLLCCCVHRAELWDVATCTRIRVLECRGPGFKRPIITQDSKFICVNESAGISILDLKSGLRNPIATLRHGAIAQLTYSPGTGEIAFVGLNGSVYTCNPLTGVVKKSPRESGFHFGAWFGIATAPDGRAVFYGGKSGEVRRWNLGL